MPKDTIETVDLTVFLAVARNGSFGAAAQELRLSTPSVSGRMSALERKLRCELFVRTARGSSLTTSGERFRAYARRCLDILEEAHHTVPLPAQESVVLAIPASLGAALFAPAMTVLADARITAHGRIADSDIVVDNLLDGSSDLGFLVNGVRPSVIEIASLGRSQLVAVSRSDHPLATLPAVTLHDLLTTRVLVYRWAAEAEGLAETFHHRDRSPNHPVQMLGLPSAILDLVIKTHCVGIVPEFGLNRRSAIKGLVALPTTFPVTPVDVDLAYHRRSVASPAVLAMTARLKQLSPAIGSALPHRRTSA